MKEASWSELVRFHGELLSRSESPDAHKIRQIGLAEGYSLPPWFLGSVRAAEKLKAKHPLGAKLIGTTEAVEMASRSEVARWRWRHLPVEKIKRAYIPACGLGLDGIHLLDEFLKQRLRLSLRLSDLNPLHAKMTSENLSRLGYRDAVQVFCEDLGAPAHAGEDFDFVFLDPARRGEGQRYGQGEYRPSLRECFVLAHRAPYAQIKLAPGFKLEEATALGFPLEGWSFEWVQRNRDMVECMATRRIDELRPCLVRASWLRGGDALEFEAQAGIIVDRATENLRPPFLIHIPAKCLRSADLVGAWARSSQLQALPWHEVYGGPSPVEGGLQESYQILEAGRCERKVVKGFLRNYEGYAFEVRVISGSVPRDVEPWLARCARQKGDPRERLTLLLVARGRRQEILLGKAELASPCSSAGETIIRAPSESGNP